MIGNGDNGGTAEQLREERVSSAMEIEDDLDSSLTGQGLCVLRGLVIG